MLTLFAASFLMIAAKAFQQLNVVHDRYCAVLPTSALLAAMEVFIIVGVVRTGWIAIPSMALGGGLGCMFSMWLHKKIRPET